MSGDSQIDKKFGWEIFNKAINDQEIDCTVVDLYKFLTRELKIDLDGFDKPGKISVSLLVPILSKDWTGWKFDVTNEIIKNHKFDEFIKYLTDAIQDIINKEGESLPHNKHDDQHVLTIYCPPQSCSSLICTSKGDDIMFKHHVGIAWKELTVNELVNWPHVSVTFINDDLMFTRDVYIDCQRYIKSLRCNYRTIANDILESAELLEDSRTVYACSSLESYVNEYLAALESMDVPTNQYTEISTILHDFIQDIKAMNIQPPLQTIATNTKLRIRLHSEYIRNKKLSKFGNNKTPDPDEIGFCEIITPKVELILNYFRATLLNTSEQPTFGILDNCKTNGLSNILPKIYYKCSYCNREFIKDDSLQEIVLHLYTAHKLENQVRCLTCKHPFELMELARSRWNHVCPKIKS